MKRFIKHFTLLALVSVTLGWAQEVQVVTEEYPPYNYTENGTVTGVNTDVVRAILDRLEQNHEINVNPWARSYDLALEQPNVMIYSISRTEQREDLFKWVGDIAPVGFYLISREGGVGVASLEQAKAHVVGTVRDDVIEQYLVEEGFELGVNIDRTSSHVSNLKKLVAGRIDLIAVSDLTAAYYLRQLGYNPDEVLGEKLLLEPISVPLYMAFNLGTSDETVARYQQTLDALKADGTYQQIINAYQ